MGNFELVIDPLSAVFIFITSLLAIPVSVFSIGYLQAEYIKKDIGILCSLYHLFLLSMLLLVSCGNGFLFLILWECMTLLSFAFVISDTNSEESKYAGFIYLLMTHIGTAFLLFMFLILTKYSGSFSFVSYSNLGNVLPLEIKLILFICLLIGFGTKAGLIPLHIWLPEAHPAAPSHISALMSGVMIKTAIYGILRCVFNFLSPFPYWWGLILAVVATLTAILGIIYASNESDIKRLLAFSSIENMGIILLPIGIGMVFFSFNQKELAMLAIIAGLLHAVNHSVFKGLLFLSAGAIISVVHTRNLEKMGGLIKSIPQVAFFFLVGSLAISAFPPLNGFISEWFIFQSLLLSFNLDSCPVKVIAPLCAALLGFTGAICATTFIKVFSGAFLAMPRSHQASHTHEVSLTMKLGMGILTALCFALGIMPYYVIKLLKNSVAYMFKSSNELELSHLNKYIFSLGIGIVPFAEMSPIFIFIFFIFLFGLVYFLVSFSGSRMPVRKEETWSCGVTPHHDFEYTPKSYTQPLQVVFSQIHTPESFYYKYFYLPVVNGFMKLSHGVKPLQSGILQIYLAYIFITLILCLIWIRL